MLPPRLCFLCAPSVVCVRAVPAASDATQCWRPPYTLPSLLFDRATRRIGERGMATQFGWNNQKVGAIYSAFGWGYTFTQVPGAWFCQTMGPRWTWFLFCGVLSGVATMVMPVGAYMGWVGAAICRFVVGIGQGPLYPTLSGVQGVWVHETERSLVYAVVNSMWPGAQAFQALMTPWLMEEAGWEYAFVLYGVLILGTAYVWRRYARDRPEDDPDITPQEKAYLSAGKDTNKQAPMFGVDVYVRVLKNKCVLGLMATACIDGLGTPIFLSYLPQYLVTQMNMDVSYAAIMASLPLFGNLGGTLFGGFAADLLIKRGVDRLTVRRCFYMVPRIYYALCGLALTLEPSVGLVVFISISQQTVDGIAASGLWVNPLDLSEDYTAAIMGLMNCFANLTYCA
eukprot:SAG22_NODE_382_length_11344_cov_41.312228_3_plen_397_part_00